MLKNYNQLKLGDIFIGPDCYCAKDRNDKKVSGRKFKVIYKDIYNMRVMLLDIKQEFNDSDINQSIYKVINKSKLPGWF